MIALLSSFESYFLTTFKWPSWALRVVGALSSLITIIGVIQLLIYYLNFNSNKIGDDAIQNKRMNKYSIDFRIFQLQYLSVYLIVMLPDWLQGTNMYTLYSSYGVNVGTLFLTGFMSSAVFGTFLGIRVDTWGRKFGCIVFCILKVIINLIEHIPSMPALLFGRILGGLSTALLFTAFESWMVSEHRKRGFDETLLSSTFSISSWGNGFVAIFAGFLAQYSSGKYFICDPFD